MSGLEHENEQDGAGESEQRVRRRRRGLLHMYYGMDSGEVSRRKENPLDIDSTGFKSDQYIEHLLKESSLNELYASERQMRKEVKELDSNMQYLVYENHSKFITASETIKEMKDDFQRLEDDMGHLGSGMEEISESSKSINAALADRRQQINKLTSVHHMLKKLQFVIELPIRLKKCIEMGSFSMAVRYYNKAQHVLEQYRHQPSFEGIQRDCTAIVSELKTILKQRLGDQTSKPAVIAESVDLLLDLKEPPEELCQQFLSSSQHQLEEDLNMIEAAAKVEAPGATDEEHITLDSVEFVSMVCNGFLGNLSLVIQSCFDMFIRRPQNSSSGKEQVVVSQQTLVDFVHSLLMRCLKIVEGKLVVEAKLLNSSMLARALDKLHARLVIIDQLIPAAKISIDSHRLVKRVMLIHSESHAECLKQKFSTAIMDVRQALAMSKGSSASSVPPLNDHRTLLYNSVKTELENSITSLQEFIGSNVGFGCMADFREEFCVRNVRLGVVVRFLENILHTCQGYTEMPFQQAGSTSSASSLSASASSAISYPPALILILSSLVHDMEQSHISYLTSYADEKFPPEEEEQNVATPTDGLILEAENIAERLLNHYVSVQGQVIAQMIRKSVETRDWLNTMEPRNVRSVMRRLVEELSSIDKQVGLLFEEGSKRNEGSETSHTYTYSLTRGKGGFPYSSNSGMDSSLMSNIQKLFYERIEVFGAVEFNKLSIVTGIVKIALKALVECVRLRTFGKYGIQQMQVDAHYLQIYLWRYVSDEQLVRVLLDEVLSSTMQRCIEPSLMEQSVVELICDKA